jgi:hypothetical protein
MSPTRLFLPAAIGLAGLGLALACAAPTTAAVIGGTPGDDRLFGTAQADMIRGKGGDDLLVGRAGGDTLKGSTGADVMYGHRGRDYFVPGNGRDLVYGGRGDDTVEFWSHVGSGPGPDKGADQVRLGTGNDIVHASPTGTPTSTTAAGASTGCTTTSPTPVSPRRRTGSSAARSSSRSCPRIGSPGAD